MKTSKKKDYVKLDKIFTWKTINDSVFFGDNELNITQSDFDFLNSKNVNAKHKLQAKETQEEKRKSDKVLDIIEKVFTIFMFVSIFLTVIDYILQLINHNPNKWYIDLACVSSMLFTLIVNFWILCEKKYRNPCSNKNMLWNLVLCIAIVIFILVINCIFSYMSKHISYLVIAIISGLATLIIPSIWSDVLRKTDNIAIEKRNTDRLLKFISFLLQIPFSKKKIIESNFLIINLQLEYIQNRAKILKYYSKHAKFMLNLSIKEEATALIDAYNNNLKNAKPFDVRPFDVLLSDQIIKLLEVLIKKHSKNENSRGS